MYIKPARNSANALVIVIILIGLLLGLAIWYQNRQTKIRICAVRQQDRDLEIYYYSKGITPTTDQLLETYKVAEADCQ